MKNLKIVLLTASKTQGGAEKNLIRIFSNLHFEFKYLIKPSIFTVLREIRHKGKVIILPLGYKNSLYARIVKIIKYHRIKIIGSIRATEYQKSKLRITIDIITSGLFDIWVSNSIAGKNIYIGREKIPEQKIKIIYNKPSFKNVNAKKYGNSQIGSKLQILMVGHFRNEKSYYRIPPIIKELKKLDLDFEITIIGKGIVPNDLLNLSNNPDSNLNIVDSASRIDEYYLKSDILLNVSSDEGLPTVFLEGGSNGLPIVASNVSGNSEYVWHGYNGFLCDQGNSLEYAYSILEISKNIDEFRQNALARFSVYEKHVKNDTQSWKNLIEELL